MEIRLIFVLTFFSGAPKPKQYLTVFVTSQKYNGNLGGINGADMKCQGLANVSGLDGTFKAWISNGNISPSNYQFGVTIPYQLVDGTTIANSWADLTDGFLQHPIDRNEENQFVDSSLNGFGNGRVWTNTNSIGKAININNGDCAGWTSSKSEDSSVIGRLDLVNEENFWTDVGTISCDRENRLYCFQHDEVSIHNMIKVFNC